MTYNTGNPIGSTDARDLSDNAENFDKALGTLAATWTDRLGVTRDSFEGRLAKGSFYRAGTFAAGYTLTNMRQTLEYSGHEYSWAGTFPKVVAAGATPATSGGISAGAWVDRTDVTLRNELASQNGASGIGGGVFVVPDFSSALLSSGVSSGRIATKGHTLMGWGGAEYVRDGTTGSASTGTPYKFYNGDGTGWVLVGDMTLSKFGALNGGDCSTAFSIMLGVAEGLAPATSENAPEIVLFGDQGAVYTMLNPVQLPYIKLVIDLNQSIIKIPANQIGFIYPNEDFPTFSSVYQHIQNGCIKTAGGSVAIQITQTFDARYRTGHNISNVLFHADDSITSAGTFVTVQGVAGLSFINCEFRGSYNNRLETNAVSITTNSTLGADAITVDIRFDGCKFLLLNAGIIVGTTSGDSHVEGLRIINSQFTNVDTCVQTDGCLVTEVRNNIFTQCRAGCIIANGGGCIVSDNIFESLTGVGIRYTNNAASDGATICNNVIQPINSNTIGIQVAITGAKYLICNNLTNNTIIGGLSGTISGIGILFQNSVVCYIDTTGCILQRLIKGVDASGSTSQVTKIKLPIAVFLDNTENISVPLNLLSSNTIYPSTGNIDVAGIERVASDINITSTTGGINSQVIDVVNTSALSVTFMSTAIPSGTHKLFININGTWVPYA